jgi:NitT/TauT family transport system ATP-binding protein
MMGLLVLLNSHKGDEEIARLADDLDLEIDEILPAVEFAEVLGLVSVTDGQARLTETGRRLLAGTISGRKTLLREQLKRTKLFKTLERALESAPDHRLNDEQVNQIVALTTAPADSLVQNIINWGRYAEMFRYDSDEHLLLPIRSRAARASTTRRTPPPAEPETLSPTGIPPAKPGNDPRPAEQLGSLA